jgi:hypothetical protein
MHQLLYLFCLLAILLCTRFSGIKSSAHEYLFWACIRKFKMTGLIVISWQTCAVFGLIGGLIYLAYIQHPLVCGLGMPKHKLSIIYRSLQVIASICPRLIPASVSLISWWSMGVRLTFSLFLSLCFSSLLCSIFYVFDFHDWTCSIFLSIYINNFS